jgi:hypothetical protein
MQYLQYAVLCSMQYLQRETLAVSSEGEDCKYCDLGA